MSVVEKCLNITKSIYNIILDGSEETRDDWTSEVNQLLDEREKILPLIKEPFTTEEREMSNQIMQINNKIEEGLVKNRAVIQDNIHGLRAKKTNVKKYIDPYDQVNRDGTFYDKRK
ncbi:hypothetical protein [Jeotgalibacillus salarius]|uniref:Flagellar protein FliT n=1 Tax=Jeotgalibacillus salarius TaxID=546023 RepID=A0A4Y8LR42_9BACL|nr:hypothetical protein [Jeotgalibacillus salarius]TFE03929.1 hypothetical protein E2626_00975 [Jeotgalibacillus salarius]